MSEAPNPRRLRLGAAAGLLGAAAAVTAIVGAGPAPSVFEMIGAKEDISGNCDEAEHANDPECAGTPTTGGTVDDSTTSTTVGDGSTSTTAAPAADVRAIDAAGAGTVLVAVEDGSLRLVAATPSSGWQVEVEQAAGREIEVDFRSGTRRVQVNVEFEDGQVRERVRVRDDADNSGGSSGPGSSGVDDSADDHSGPGRSGDDDSADDSVDDSSGHSSDDSADDDSVDDDSGDDHGGSGHGGDDDSPDDDSSGHGSDD